MNPILLAVLLVSGIGLVLGVFLVISNRVFAVKENETAKKIQEALPGANCGACGFSGCSGYAAALAEDKTVATTLCTVGGNDVAARIAEILGVEAGSVASVKARVMCQGHKTARSYTADYTGLSSCRAAAALYNGGSACAYGCLGYGDCVAACEKEAISVCQGVAVVSPALCVGCGKCAAVCPKGIIQMVTEKQVAVVPCANKDKGAATKKACTVGCLGCKVCLKACPEEAIRMEEGLAVVDAEKCVGCGKCVAACKFGVIKMV